MKTFSLSLRLDKSEPKSLLSLNFSKMYSKRERSSFSQILLLLKTEQEHKARIIIAVTNMTIVTFPIVVNILNGCKVITFPATTTNFSSK